MPREGDVFRLPWTSMFTRAAGDPLAPPSVHLLTTTSRFFSRSRPRRHLSFSASFFYECPVREADGFQSRISRLDEARTMSFHAFSSICVLFRHFVASFYISRNEFVRSFVFRFVITRIVILFVSLIIYAACLYKFMSHLCYVILYMNCMVYIWYMSKSLCFMQNSCQEFKQLNNSS